MLCTSFGSTLNDVARPELCGSNVISMPVTSTAVHWVVAGHDTSTTALAGSKLGSIRRAVAARDEAGLNVSCSPSGSTAVHWVTDGQVTATRDGPMAPTTGAFAGCAAEAASGM